MKSFSEQISGTLQRLDFYARGYLREILPRTIYEYRRSRIFEEILRGEHAHQIASRVNYYNKLDANCGVIPQTPLNRIDRSKSRYFFDLAQYLKYFPKNLKVDTLWGDVTEVPPTPRILKSRPIGTGNTNSILFNLDKLRHYSFFPDKTPWSDKVPKAVWRGRINNPMRSDLVTRFSGNQFCDVGHIGQPHQGIKPKGFLSPTEQFGFRYIVSVEGNDVATNLKWIMASNSICLMPAPRYETWFMEGRLKPDHHFVLLKDDFSDMEEKIEHLESNPDMARAINENARAYVTSLMDPRSETHVSLLVLQKYFEATGQLPPSDFANLFFPKE